MSRNEVTEKIITAKVLKGISWASVAERVGQSKEWTTAACLGQMTFTSSQAAIVAELFDLDADDQNPAFYFDKYSAQVPEETSQGVKLQVQK